MLAYAGATALVYFTLPFYRIDNPLIIALQADVLATLAIFIFSLSFRNSSLYDPYWSIIPPLIIYYWIAQTNFSTFNLLVLAIILLWGIRLTYNWIRGWKGLTHEDWRYVQLREQNPKSYQLINLFGIHFFPTLIVLVSLLPFYFAITKTSSVTALHITGLVISFTGFLLQLISDEQLHAWRKKEKHDTCINSGLWKFSRHPNYLGEIVFWWGGWFLAMGTNPEYYWTGLGPLALTGMFIFISIPMIEKRHLQRRPCYEETIKQIPMLIGRRV